MMDNMIYSNITFYKRFVENYDKKKFFIYSSPRGKSEIYKMYSKMLDLKKKKCLITLGKE